MPVQILRGMRQCGKSSLLAHLAEPARKHVTLDDLRVRQTALADPALFFLQYPPPIIVDEVQYAPTLFPEIKLRVDALRMQRLAGKAVGLNSLWWLTGSNQVLLANHVRETLSGRAAYNTLHTLSISELTRGVPSFALPQAFLRGGWPELYIDPGLDVTRYLNDYVGTFLEKDVAQSAGIQKLQSFGKALGLLASRTACVFNASEIALHCGVKSVTVQEWTSVLERNLVLHLLPGYQTNLNKRLTKSPKLYFLDTGLAARLQGWSDVGPLLNSPQAGLLFETLVLSEIIKTRDHFAKDWSVYFWRTKEGDEIDFLVMNRQGTCAALEAKLGVQSVAPVAVARKRRPGLPEVREIAVVTIGGEKQMLSTDSVRIPISEAASYLLETLA